MVDVDHDREVDRVGWQLGIVDRAEHRDDVGRPGFRNVLLQEIEHPLLNIVGVDLSHRTDRSHQLHRDVPGTGTHIGHRRSFLDLQQPNRQVWILFPFPLAALEPRGALHAHRLRVHATADRMDSRLLRRDSRSDEGSDDDRDGASVRTRPMSEVHAFFTVNSNGMPANSPVILISLPETTPLYESSSGIPPKSRVTPKEMVLPSTLPSLIGICPPSGPVVEPVSLVPSALNS